MEQKNQTLQTEDGVSFSDILRLLLGKLKLLILLLLIGGILGGAFAVWKTIDINYFGTKVEFYVNPEKPKNSTGSSAGTAAGGSQYGVYGAYGRHVMDNMIKLLSSDSFAEKLLLNGDPLPSTETQWFDEKEKTKDGISKNEALANAIAATAEPLAKVTEAETAYNTALAKKSEALNTYNKAEETLNIEWSKARANSGVLFSSATYSEKAYEEVLPKLADYEDLSKLTEARSAFISAQSAVLSQNSITLEYESAWLRAKEAAFEGENSPVEKALNIWRESDLYAAQLNFFKNSISYDYLESNEDREDANNLARSFIYVTISIQNSNFDKGFAVGEMLLDRVKRIVPLYVEENMTVPAEYDGTNCQRITRTDSIRLTNPNFTTNQAIKYAILTAAIFFVAACVVIILLDKSDKRLRDTEIITRKLNVPLLGIVPTIEELAEQTAKKKTEKTTEVK